MDEIKHRALQQARQTIVDLRTVLDPFDAPAKVVWASSAHALAAIDAALASPVPAAPAVPQPTDERRLIAALQSLLDRMANDARTGLMFEGDGDTLRDAITFIRRTAQARRFATPASPAVPASASVATDLHAAIIKVLSGHTDMDCGEKEQIAKDVAAELVSASVAAPVPLRMLTPDEFYDATEEGGRSFRSYSATIRGQMLRAEDSPDYHVAVAVQRKFCEVNGMKVGAAPAAEGAKQ